VITSELIQGKHPLTGVLAALSTGDWIAVGTVALTVLGAFLAYRQLVAARKTARAQFLLDMDQAFAQDEPIRTRLASPSEEALKQDEWRAVKRYMGRFERVGVFVAEGLLDLKVVERLYASRFRNIVRNDEIRKRLLEKPERAKGWMDFIDLWRKLDEHMRKSSGDGLCSGVAPKPAPWPYEHGDRAIGAAGPDDVGYRDELQSDAAPPAEA
jgi:hypothetical protein